MYKSLSLKIVLIILFVLIVVGIGYTEWKKLDNSNKLENPNNIPTKPISTNSSKTYEIDISDWKNYQNEKYGFALRYPPYLDRGKRLFQQQFSPVSNQMIISFSDGSTDELIISVSPYSLDGYIVSDNPDGVSYRFDQALNRWFSSVHGEITGKEPKLVITSVTSYRYQSGDGKCSWQGAVIPHPKEQYIVEIKLVRCLDEDQLSRHRGNTYELSSIVDTFHF
jgi:hypothetical protein